MKIKTLVIAIFALCFALTVKAQENKYHKTGHLSFRPYAGVSLSKLFGNKGGSGLRFGFTGGVEGEYMLLDNVSAAVGVCYNQQGAQCDITFSPEEFSEVFGIQVSEETELKTTFKFDYINVPILASFYITDDLALRAGVQLGFLVSQRLKIASGDWSDENNIALNIKKLDLAFPVGLLCDFNHIILELRYNVGAMRINKKNNGVTNGSLTNSVIMFTAGYRF